ncbi:MAG TPA: hypothetical protein VII47_03790 [Actinomycetota bacterium]
MELDGHPTHDLVEELERRGGRSYPGTAAGPDPRHLELEERRGSADPGLWLFLPPEAYNTEIDEPLESELGKLE